MKEPSFVVESTPIPLTAFETAMHHVRQGLSYSLKLPEPICLALAGESRTGKSRVFKATQLLMPRKPTTASGALPILNVMVPERTTAEGMVSLHLHASGEPKWKSLVDVHQTGRLRAQLRERKTLMILLDEFQYLN
jgi:ABC-type dipeptide/oligopeptide/nickel transport system ATPase component